MVPAISASALIPTAYKMAASQPLSAARYLNEFSLGAKSVFDRIMSLPKPLLAPLYATVLLPAVSACTVTLADETYSIAVNESMQKPLGATSILVGLGLFFALAGYGLKMANGR